MAKNVDLFSAAMADVTPLKGRKSQSRVTPKPKPEGVLEPGAGTLSALATARSAPSRAEAFDRDIDRALARGKRAPEAKLDLHGMTLAAAERAVARFLAEASAQRRRIVLVVTGKGLRLEGGRAFGGRIRAEFPRWLEGAEMRVLVAGIKTAHPRHGGGGAFYVLLRRKK